MQREFTGAAFQLGERHFRQQRNGIVIQRSPANRIQVAPPAEEVRAPAPDLMSALKASLDAVRAQDADVAVDGAPNGAPSKPKPRAKKPAAKKPAAKKPAAKKTRARAAAKG